MPQALGHVGRPPARGGGRETLGESGGLEIHVQATVEMSCRLVVDLPVADCIGFQHELTRARGTTSPKEHTEEGFCVIRGQLALEIDDQQ